MKKIYYFTVLCMIFLLGNIASAQTPAVHGLTMDATTPSYSTNDDLEANYTTSGGAVETATTWYINWVPVSVLNFPFEAGYTNALQDYSGNGNDLSTSGTASTEPGWSASAGYNTTGAFTFDGNDYLLAGEVLPLNSDYTKCAWINISSEFGYRNIISGDLNGEYNHGFKINPDGRLNSGHSGGSYYVIDSDSLHNDVWYFVAVTFDYESGLMILYKDGIEVDRAIVPVLNRSVVDPTVLIGSKAYAFFFNGSIDEAQVYDRALSAEQIQSFYINGDDIILSQETRGDERWRVRVTPFSDSEIGNDLVTGSELIQAAAISGLSLTASSPESLTNDDLTASFTSNVSVVETATAWYRDGNPDALMYLPFDGGAEEALLDVSGSDNHASQVWNMLQDPTWDANGGHNGSGAFEFDGDDYLEMGNIFPLNSSYTKTAWVYSTVLGFNNIISSYLHGDNNHFFKMNADGRLNAGHRLGDAEVIDGAAMALDTWYFVAVTFDYATGEMILYKNGVDVNSATVPLALRDVADEAVLIGAMNNIFGWDGYIDEARLYDRALSPEQISAMFSGDNVMVAEETIGGEEWHVEVIPFSSSESGSSTTSNTVEVHSLIVSDIVDQTVAEGVSFSSLDLDDYVAVYEFTEADLVWSSNGSSELIVAIDPVTHEVTVTIPDADWTGSEDITFTATNPNGEADSTEVAYTVSNINDAPVLAVIGGQLTDEDINLTLLPVVFTDADPLDTHTITILSSNPNVVPSDPSGDISGSTYDLVPAANWNGSTQITVTVRDDGTETLYDFEEYTLLVNAVNDAPVLTHVGPQSTNEDTNLTGLSVVFSDADDDQHTITVVSDDASVNVANLTGDINGSLYDLVPADDWNGTAQITVRVTDNGTGALSDFETYTLTVNAINDAPVITPTGSQSMDEDNTLSLSVVFTDVDVTDSHIFTAVSSEANVSVENLSGNTYDLVPAADWNGSAQITTTVTDNGIGALSDTETFTLTVNPVNDAPVDLVLSNLTVDENSATGTIVGTFSSTELDDGDTHTYALVAGDMGNDNAAFSIDGDELKTDSQVDYETKNVYWIRVQSADGDGGTAVQTFVITVNNMQEVGIPEVSESLSFNVYPVPAIDNVTVEIDNPDNKELLLEIYSNSGRLVHDEMIYSKTKIDLTGFTDGMYILRIKGDHVYGTRKIIVKDR